jgi:hypothetical protein
MSRLTPEIGQWYQDSQSGQMFEVVARDSAEGSVQVQYVDGELSDLDLESWADMPLRPAAAPEDWRTGFEVDTDDDGDPDAALHPTAWSSPLEAIEPDTMYGVEDS